MNKKTRIKTPTLREKVEMYERLLHLLYFSGQTGKDPGFYDAVTRIGKWSYAHRAGNGMLTDRQQQKIVNEAFWKLCGELDSIK